MNSRSTIVCSRLLTACRTTAFGAFLSEYGLISIAGSKLVHWYPGEESSFRAEAQMGLATAHLHSWLGAVPCWALDVASGSSVTQGCFITNPHSTT